MAVGTDVRACCDCLAVRFERSGKTIAVATIYRDEESLRAELDMEGQM